MANTDIKLLLYKLINQLSEAKETREQILAKHKSQMTPEIKDQLEKLDKLIESVEAQIKLLL